MLPRALVWRGITPDGLRGGWTTNQNVRVRRDVATGEPAAYCDGDFVAFTDEGMVADIQIQDGDVRPGDVLFDHGLAVTTYTLLGGGIAGCTSVTKQGREALSCPTPTFSPAARSIAMAASTSMTNPKALNKLVVQTAQPVEFSPGTAVQSLRIT